MGIVFGLGIPELILILILALLIFGPRKLPELGGFLGKALRDFRDSLEQRDQEEQPPASPPRTNDPPPTTSTTASEQDKRSS